jgi:zinc protease
VLCDAVLHSIFDPDEIAREIDVVLEEIRRSDDSPGSVLSNAVFDTAYSEHPYRHPILGTRESVAAFDRARVRRFYERWYAPDNLVAIAVGSFDRGEVLARIRDAFADRAPSGARRSRRPEPEQSELRSALLARPFERATAELAYPGVALSHPDAPYLDLISFLLGNCESSRLVRAVKERDGLVERIDAWSYTPLDPGATAVDFDTDAERVSEAIESIVAEVERLRALPVSKDELEKARINFLTSEHYERESVSGLAAKLGSFLVSGGGLRRGERYLDAVRNATPDGPAARRAALVAPRGAHRRRSAAGPRAQRGRRGGRSAARWRAGSSARRARRPPGAALARARARELCAARRRSAARRAARSVPLVRGARRAARRPARGGSEHVGTHRVPRLDVAARHREPLGGRIRARGREPRRRHRRVRGAQQLRPHARSPSAALEPAFDLFCEVLAEPAFDAAELERERSETLAAIERREDRLGQRAFQLLAEQLFLEHPYRMPTLGSAEVIGALDRDGVIAHHERLVRTPNLVVAVAGDVDPDAVAQMLSVRLAELDGSAFTTPFPPLEDPPREIRRAELRKDRAQAHLAIGFRGVSVADDDRFVLELISQLLAGQSGRLFLELRDRQGLAYSVTATSVEGLAPGYFAVYIATSPEKLDVARAGLLDQLQRLVDSAPRDAELEAARRHLIGNFAIDRQRNAVHAAQASLNALYGLGADASNSYPERIGAIGGKDVLRVAQRIVRLDAYCEAVVRGTG